MPQSIPVYPRRSVGPPTFHMGTFCIGYPRHQFAAPNQRCVDSSRRFAGPIVLIFALTPLGSCGTDGSLKFIPIALVLTVVETSFLALCCTFLIIPPRPPRFMEFFFFLINISTVLYAVWKSTLYPAAQGRLSIALSEKAPADDPRDDTIRRGWWDYVPRAPASDAGSVRPNQVLGSANGHATRPSNDDSLVKRLRNSVMRLTTSIDIQQHQSTLEPLEPQTFTRKPSLPTEYPLSQPPRPRHQPQQSQVSEKDRIGARSARHSTAVRSEVAPSARATSVKSINFAPQATSQRSSRIDPLQPVLPRHYDDENVEAAAESLSGKRLPAVLQVRAVIKDEVCSIFFGFLLIPNLAGRNSKISHNLDGLLIRDYGVVHSGGGYFILAGKR